jgi:crossover junction endodeoxyribonuclease RusA
MIPTHRKATKIKLTLPFPPSANHMIHKGNGRRYRSKAYKQFLSEVFWIVRGEGVELVEGDIAITLHVYRKMKRGDLDNRIKPTLDALNGVVYNDDKQIVEIHAYRHDDKNNPRVEVVIESKGDIG